MKALPISITFAGLKTLLNRLQGIMYDLDHGRDGMNMQMAPLTFIKPYSLMAIDAELLRGQQQST